MFPNQPDAVSNRLSEEENYEAGEQRNKEDRHEQRKVSQAHVFSLKGDNHPICDRGESDGNHHPQKLQEEDEGAAPQYILISPELKTGLNQNFFVPVQDHILPKELTSIAIHASAPRDNPLFSRLV